MRERSAAACLARSVPTACEHEAAPIHTVRELHAAILQQGGLPPAELTLSAPVAGGALEGLLGAVASLLETTPLESAPRALTVAADAAPATSSEVRGVIDGLCAVLSAYRGQAQLEEVSEDELDLGDLFEGAAAPAQVPEPPEARDGAPAQEAQLRRLALRGFPPADAATWAPVWRAVPAGLQRLELAACALSDHAISGLCGAFALMRKAEQPKELLLPRNNCKNLQHVCPLVEAGDLELLDLDGNLLNQKSAQQLAEALASPHARLRALSLAANRTIGLQGVSVLSKTLERGPLRSLVLDGTGLCDEGAALLAEALGRGGLRSLSARSCAGLSSSAVQGLLAATTEQELLLEDEDGAPFHWAPVLRPEDLLDSGSAQPESGP